MNLSITLPVKRPSLTLLGTEPWRAAQEYLSHKLSRQPFSATGDGHPVLIFPGLATGAMAVAPLRKFCTSMGYAAYDWGRGYNLGPQGEVNAWLDELAVHCYEVLQNHGQAATLVGWSLGGIYARELAKLMPNRVRQVITIGTPFNAEADYSNVGWLYRRLAKKSAPIDATLIHRLRTPPPVPTTSIFSRSDGIVAWQSCLHASDRHQVEDIEIQGSHLGMGWNRAVLSVLTDRLAQKPGKWMPYKNVKAQSKIPTVP